MGKDMKTKDGIGNTVVLTEHKKVAIERLLKSYGVEANAACADAVFTLLQSEPKELSVSQTL